MLNQDSAIVAFRSADDRGADRSATRPLHAGLAARLWAGLWLVAAILVTAPAATAESLRGREESTDRQESPSLFRVQYHVPDASFCYASACVDIDDDGRRDLFFASRATRELSRLNAADGRIVWSRTFDGEQQSISAFDVNRDGRFEVLYTVSSPGRMYAVDAQGTVLRQWDADDNKLGNSPVVIDGDGDGVLDGYLGSRSLYLLRLNMEHPALTARREGWSQCGCHTSAMDVDGDGRWDLFAGDGDDFGKKGVLHRFDPRSLESIWHFDTNDNASSADAVLVDLDGDGRVEILKSVDNYQGDDAHDAVYAFTTDGQMLWKVAGLAGEDSPNAADLDGDGRIEIVGMTFGGDVYCLNSSGETLWRRDLRPECDNGTHMYMAPILCDLNGDRELEILAITSGAYFGNAGEQSTKPPAVIFALNAAGEVLDQLNLESARYFGEAFVCQLDDDPNLELVLSGSGGLDVIETRGFGPDTEYFQRRRSYQRLNVLPWAYEETYFIERGRRESVVNRTDDLVLAAASGQHVAKGTFVTSLLTLPPDCAFSELRYSAETPPGTAIQVDVLDTDGRILRETVSSGTLLNLGQSVHLAFHLSTSEPQNTPVLHSCRLAFDQRAEPAGTSPGQAGLPSPAGSGSAGARSVGGGSADVGQTLLVDAAGRTHRNATVSVALTEGLGEDIGVVETTGGTQTPVPSQIVPGSPPHLWWIAAGELPQGSRRTFRVVRSSGRKGADAAASDPAASDAAMTVDRQREFVEIRRGSAPVLRYNSAHVSAPEGVDPRYGRSAFIHPVRTPLGVTVTDQFPADHLHQSGIFLAHTRTEFEGRTPNFWDLAGGTGRVRFRELRHVAEGSVFAEFQTVHDHVDLSSGTEKTALSETWTVRVWNPTLPQCDAFVFDVASELQCASDSTVRLLNYHYGGMALRGATQWTTGNATFVTAEGLDRISGNHTRTRWCDLSGRVGEQTAGITILTHPDNFRFPEPLRIHPTMPYMVYSPSHLGDWEITPAKPHVTRYRFIAHDGSCSQTQTEVLWQEFAKPLVARVLAGH